jgi:hypothetical protein
MATVSSVGKSFPGLFSGVGPVRRISIPWMFDIVSAIDDVDKVEAGAVVSSKWPHLFSLKKQLEAVFAQSIYSGHLKVSREKADELYAWVDSLIGDNADQSRTIDDTDVWVLKYRRDAFKTVFLAELSTLPSFLVTGKEGYDLALLIDEGTKLFPPTLAVKVPEAIRDAREVGKAIAFELSTAAGFHIFRVVEAVLKRYWDHASSGKKRPKPETIGTFASALEDNNAGDPKIWESLKQLAKLHRNPLIHPEVILDVGEEIEILGISRSVIGAMLKVMPDVPTTTTTALLPPTGQP